MLLSLALPILLQAVPPAPAAAPTASARILRLDAAVATAVEHQPTLRQAHAQSAAAEGRITQARAGFFPQLTATASYQRVRTASFGGRGSTTGVGVGGTPVAIAPATNTAGVDVFTFGGNATLILWDWGSTYHRWRAAQQFAGGLGTTEKAVTIAIVADVRRAYFAARAQKALVGVGRDALANLERHLRQIQGFVSAGTRPEIDLAQARTDVATGRLDLIDAENAYGTAKAQLGQSMGVDAAGDFDVGDDELGPVEGEESTTEQLVNRAAVARPEVAALEKQREGYEHTAKSLRGNYGPTLSAAAGASETGTDIADLGPAWNVGVTLSWPFFQGGVTRGQVHEAEATIENVRAQTDGARLQVRLEVEQAQISLRSAKASQATAAEVVINARERLRLAEGRYTAGVGNVIELGDAQLALTTASAQVVQAQFRLASARADLLAALGQR